MELGGVSSTPSRTTCTVEALPSISSPSRSRMVSVAPASTASWRSSTLASSATDLMSQRAQRVSWAVMQARPSRSVLSAGHRPGRAVAEHRGGTCGQRRVVAAVFGAARQLQVDVLVAAAIGGRPAPAAAPAIDRGVCGLAMRSAAGAARQPVEVQAGAEQPAAIHRHHFIDAITEQEAAIQRRDRGLRPAAGAGHPAGTSAAGLPPATRTRASRCRRRCATGRLRRPWPA